jgi:hypothetical protein
MLRALPSMVDLVGLSWLAGDNCGWGSRREVI